MDGVPNQGTVPTLTGADGCIHPTVFTSGVPPSDTSDPTPAKLRFFVAGSENGEGDPIQDEVTIRVNTNWFLYAFPNHTSGDGDRIIRLLLVDSGGSPAPGVLIVVDCEADDEAQLNIEDHPGVTDANGETTAIIEGNGFAIVGEDGPSGECTFRTINNEAETVVEWNSVDICDFFSPSPPQGCPSANLTVTLLGTGTVASTQPSNELECAGPGNCTATFSPFENVTLLASPTPVSWTGPACAACTGSTCTIALGAEGTNTTCTITYPP